MPDLVKDILGGSEISFKNIAGFFFFWFGLVYPKSKSLKTAKAELDK